MKLWLVLPMIAIVAVGRVGNSTAAEPTTTLLWPDGAPGAMGTSENDKPKLIHYPAEKKNNTGTAIVICPGGGYGGLAMGHEGHDIGRWLNSLGISAFIVDYRHRGKGYGHPAPLQDAQRALRTVRSGAAVWSVQPDKVGILGFSAGGHLASTTGTHFDAGNPDARDPIQKTGSRPDFMILCYPVIAFDQPYTHRGSQRNLLGDEASPELTKSLSNETQVTPQTPPTFLFHTNEDKAVPPENSIVFYSALRRHQVPAELHVFSKGRHGLGLAESVEGTEQWPTACEAWLTNLGFLPEK